MLRAFLIGEGCRLRFCERSHAAIGHSLVIATEISLNTRFSHPSEPVPVAKGSMANAAKFLIILAVTGVFGRPAEAQANPSARTGQAVPQPSTSHRQPRLLDVTFRTPRPTRPGPTSKALRRDDSRKAGSARDARDAGSAAPVLVYLNAGGSVITGGADDPARNASWIVASAGGDVRFPAYSGNARAWQAITACVRETYRDFAVDFTDQRPHGTDYSMIVVGGSPSLLGLNDAVGGIAPADSEVLRNAVGFVFSPNAGNRVDDVCEAIVHEVGHTLGLDHAYRCEDPMSYLNGCGPKRFADVAAPCGEYAARSCDGGAATQNSYRKLMALVGGRSDATPNPLPVQPPVVEDDKADDAAVGNDSGVLDPYHGYHQDQPDIDDADANTDDAATDVDYSSDTHSGDTQCPQQQTSSNQQRHPRTQGRRGHQGAPHTRPVRVTRITRLWLRDRSGAWQLVSVRTR